MKKLLLIGVFIVSTITSFAQTNDFVCGFDFEINSPDNFTQQSAFSHSTDPEVLYAKEPKVLNVKFWQVNKYGGQFGDDPNQNNDITVNEVLASIAYLNKEFNQYNIFFKYRGLGQFDSPETVYELEPDDDGFGCQIVTGEYEVAIKDEDGYNTINNLCQITDFYYYAEESGHMPDEYINIYIPYATETFRATGSFNNTKMIIKRGDLANGIMAHEMGHVLYLNHTFQGHRDLDDPLDQDNNYTDCEHVTRNENDSDYNAKLKGDLIIDTAIS